MPLLTNEMNMELALKKANITPQQINYADGQDVALGNELSLQDTVNPPELFFMPANESSQYTLMMVDPDAPSAQDNRYSPFRHWIVTNVPAQIDGTTPQQLSSYHKPAPPPGTGPHRYIFLLYEQQHPLDLQINDDERSRFDFQTFAQKNQLTLVGINFFRASSK
ncbi:phosphatidylethanolamine-binding protein [Fennellomyces sp. T-0311]|nr:phosphatidylethanolamine-binding protein [Fennellomyces sp. T-0311]